MAVHLLDVNVLVALAWPVHQHHAAAHRWFHANATSGWATCPITQCGFVRLSSNRNVLQAAVSPSAAVALIEKMIARPHHVFWSDDLPIQSNYFPRERVQGYRQVTDAYLIALCLSRDGIFATFDSASQSLEIAAAPRNVVTVIPAA